MTISAPDINRKAAPDVRSMFDSIAARYDLTNSVLSMGLHHLWRRRLIEMLPPREDLKVLDLCTGTGDLLPLLEERFAGDLGAVTGVDFSSEMLAQAALKWPSRFNLQQGDALNLLFADQSFDLVSVAFGIRNFEDLRKGLAQIARILKPGGQLLVLEFGQPQIPIFSTLYNLYSRFIMPEIGGLLTGNRAAYAYLPKTAQQFPCAEALCRIFEEERLKSVAFKPLMFGIAYAYLFSKQGATKSL